MCQKSNMNIINSDIILYEPIDAIKLLEKIEYAARTCYRSHDKISEGSAVKLISNAIARGHESILEHVQLTFKVVCSRDVLAQWTRHRIAAYSVESQRYCNYSKDKFNGFTFIMPENITDDMKAEIYQALEEDVNHYLNLLALGAKPEQARSILPNCTKTEFVWSANIREIRHFIALRTSDGAQADIAVLAHKLKNILINNGLGVLVEDI